MKQMLGQHKTNINIVPYQSTWKAFFEREAERLQNGLGEKALQIEHIGSTSIPGMAAKPVIDMMIAVTSLEQTTTLIPVLSSLGYIYRFPDTVPERMFLVKESAPDYRTHHLNLTESGSGFWKNQLTFRDYLRTHPKLAEEYRDLKLRLAEIAAQTQKLDKEGKTEFVTKVLALVAQEESQAS